MAFSRFFLAVFLSCVAIEANADCDFSTSDFISEMADPSAINEIAIRVPKSAKFVQNFIKIQLSKSKNIPSELKKNFSAHVIVKYPFGICEYSASVRQNGDWKDHVGYTKSGWPLRSLNVKLKEGNVLNAVRFKLLIPKTRKDLNEVLGTVLFRQLGFMAPETFQVRTNVNDYEAIMLFQEDAQKELLERHKRREAPIFEGDETLLWGDGRVRKDDIALSRLKNNKWFLKGKQAAQISLRAFNKLQSAYLTRTDNVKVFAEFVQPSTNFIEIFQHFHFTSLAMGAEHSFFAHNRRFYYNPFLGDFEPIYYDGNITFSLKAGGVQSKFIKLAFPKGYKFPYLTTLNTQEFADGLYSEFKKRTLSDERAAKLFVKNNFKRFIENVVSLQDLVSKIDKPLNSQSYTSKDIVKYLSRVKKHKVKQQHMVAVELHETDVSLTNESGETSKVSYEDLSKILSRTSLKKERTVLIANNNNDGMNDKKLFLKQKKPQSGELIGSENITMKIDHDKRHISIFQKTPKDWVLFRNVSLNNWTVNFIGKASNHADNDQSLRFNEYGMTGCLNFYNTIFDQTNLEVENGQCEDSINIVSSTGNIKNMVVKNGYADAVDIDFSDVSITSLLIKNAGNDCLDVSGGKYSLFDAKLKKCTDKGISVGEQSTLDAVTVHIESSLIGVSSKDSSLLTIDNGTFLDTKTCAESIQKKQEFGGGRAMFGSLKCEGVFNKDKNSSIGQILQ